MPPRFESVHLPDLEGPTGEVPPRIAKLGDHFGDLARFASTTEAGLTRQTPVRCRRRPDRMPCRGLLVVRRRDVPSVVDWTCPACQAQGQITGWEATTADLRGLELLADVEDGIWPVEVSSEAHAALRDLARSEAVLVPLAYAAEVEVGRPLLLVTPVDVERFVPVLLRHAVVSTDRQRAVQLGEVARAMRAVTGKDPDSAFVTLDAEAGAALLRKLVALDDVRPPEFMARGRARTATNLETHRSKPATYRIKVTLRDVKPPVWRRLLVPSDIELPLLHDVLQVAMGWFDCHLHQFRVGNRAFAPPGDWDPVGEDSRGVPLSALAPHEGSRLVYEYDFGDGWTHDLLVEEVIDAACPKARCLKGKGRCPPEDCGGPWGYAELLDALRGAPGQRADELREWCGEEFDAVSFDVVAVDAAVQGVPIGRSRRPARGSRAGRRGSRRPPRSSSR